MSLRPLDAARRVCERGSWKVTNLGLQKILYIAQMIYMGERAGARLVNSEFEAWDYGPVSPEVYRQAKMYGAEPVGEFAFSYEKRALEPGQAAFLDKTCDYLVGKKPSELVAITHWDRGAWAKNYIPGVRNIVIPDEDILNEYRARSQR